MAVPSILPLFASHAGNQRDSQQDSETRVATVNVPCTRLSSKSLAKWLHEEHKNYLELLQAAWSISLRSYTGSDDVRFSCLNSKNCYCHVSPSQPVRSLFNIRRAESDEENSTTRLGANSVVYVNEGHEDSYGSGRLRDLGGFDLAIYFSQETETLCPGVGVHHKPSVISTTLATMMAATVAKAMEEIVFNVDSLIESLDICSDADINRLIQWNGESSDGIPSTRCIHHVISQKCAEQQESIAVSAWDGELTYAELDSLSSALAIRLQRLGVGPEIFVPLIFDKSKWAVVSLLGVLKAGGAYFFLNPSHPIQYSRGLCSSLRPEVVLCSPGHSTLAKSFASKVVPVGEVSELLDSLPADEKNPESTAETSTSNAMYITFTSGTTGTPKGITTEHSAFYSMAMANGKELNVSAATRMLQFASYTFDVSNRDMLITLMFGGCICIPSESDRINDLSGFINRYSVNMASLTPSMASTLTPTSCPSLQTLVLGGEPMADSHISTWAKHVRLFNAYGVSESTGIAALASDIQEGSYPGNIGFGCGSTLWVVTIDQPDKLAPIGALGELVIEGPSVARGYLNDKKRSEKQFTSRPEWKERIREHFSDDHSWKRAFNTGDLVRYRLDGSLCFVGRKDHQVKVNGQRLELPSIEHHIAACVEVAESGFHHVAVVAVKSKANDSTKLVAFLGLDTSRGPDSPSEIISRRLKDKDILKATIKRHLLSHLPTYMTPADFIFLQHMPLTTSGKIHRLLLQETATHALFDDQTRHTDASDTNGNHVAITPKQRVLIQSWANALGIKDTSITPQDGFFRRGGDSIAAIKMAASLREKGFVISVSDIFNYSTLSDMASVLVEDNKNSKFLLPEVPPPFSLIDNPPVILDAILEELGTHFYHIEDVYPCTHMQQGLIALTAQNPHSYIGTYTWKLTKTLDAERFKSAWKTAWLHNPILRTRVVQIPDGIFQVVMRTEMPWNTVTDCGNVKELVEIDVNHGPLVQFYLSKEYFRIDIHHCLFDEWSLDLIIGQVERAYAGERLYTHSFSPFVQHLLHEREASVEDYWRQEFSDLQAEHFPSGASKPVGAGHAAEKVVLEHRLQFDARISTKHTLSSILRLAWAIVLWHQTGSEDVVFGSTVSGRNAKIDGIDQLSGPTLATLPLRIRLQTNQSIHEGLSQVQGQFVNMMNYEQTGLSRIRQAGREAAEACNFQNLLVVQPYEQQTTSSMFETATGSAVSSENAKAFASYPVVLTCRPEKGGLTMKAVFDPSFLAPAAGQSILRQLSHVVQQLTMSDSMRIADVSMVPPEDMALLRKWNHSLPEGVNSCIHDRIRQLCIAQPEALAVHSDDLDLTYAQIEDYSNRFALHLSGTGIKKGDFVPLLLGRSPWVPVIMLAVLKMGAAFVLLDLSHPIQRLRTMCSMLDARTVIAFKENTHISDDLQLSTVVFDPKAHIQDLDAQAIASASELPIVVGTPDAPACVVFSSGSTGLPKGIVLPHSSISTSAAVMREHGMLTPKSRVFHFASFAFDISIGEILFTLAAGACICVPQEEERRGNPAKAAGDLKVTWALLTPSVINLFDPSDVPTLEILGSAGEPLTPHIVDVWAHKVQLFGMYAPAECTVISHIGRILPDTPHSNIGHSPGAASWVADPSNHDRLVPIGTVGELIVEGAVLSSGYLKDPEKTDAVFITNPAWISEVRSYSGRMYKTGDLVRQMSDGSLQFVGRKDDQVKLHGQRLEVGEVEHCITSSCTAIRTAAVELIKIPEQKNRASLVAFICPQTEGEWGQPLNDESSEVGDIELVGSPNDDFYSTIQSLEASLKELLPSYMVPSFFIPLVDIPLSLSGKVNRRLLRNQSASWPLKRLEVYQLKSRTTAAEEVPITAHGREIQEIVAQALSLDPKSIPMNANFFGLGGDSISAMQVSMVARRRGIRLTVASIFTQQILSKIAEACAPDSEDSSTISTSHSISRSPAISESTATSSHPCEIAYDKLPSHVPRDIVDNIVEAMPATEFQVMTLHNFYSRYLWITLPDKVSREQLLLACDQLVQKHSILRTVFYTNDDKSVVQLTLRNVPIDFVHYQNVEDLEEHCAEDSLAMGVPIDGKPGFQVQLLTLKDSRTFLVLRLPHALFDGLSLDTICEDLSSAYSQNPLLPCAQFSDHVRQVWERRTPETYNVWKEVLGEAPMTSMNNKFLRNWNRPSEKETPKVGADPEQPQVVTAVAETSSITPPPGITMATLVKLAWAITLSRLFTSTQTQGEDACEQGLDDVVFGQVIHGRGLGISHEDRIVGPCLNIIPVRVRLPAGSNKSDLLDQVQRQHIQTMPVENLGLGEIARNCTSWAAGTRFSSFVRFQNFTNNDDSTCSFDGQTCETGLYSLPNRPSGTANVLVVPRGLTLTITMTLSDQVLDGESANYVVKYFSDVIGNLAGEATSCEYLA